MGNAAETLGDTETTPPSLTDAILVPEADSDAAVFKARRGLLSNLLKLARSLECGVADLSETLLQRFCTELSQYLSISHYRAFQAQVRAPALTMALAGTTRDIMQFIDRYPAGDALWEALPKVQEHLGQVALTLETRFELEDDLICQDRISLDRRARTRAAPACPGVADATQAVHH
ncbi:MAG: Rsd/AlgQ family anti-sigma factor [Pseudomonadota bacterium]